MQTYVFLGSANAMKPKIILSLLIEEKLLSNNAKVIFLTENRQGICYEYCQKMDLPVRVLPDNTFESEKTFDMLQDITDGILISLGWPYKIPSHILRHFRAAINCHGSILPDYRGNRAYMHYWANCAQYYGASIHYMNEKFDDGNVLIQGKLKQYMTETPEMIFQRTAELCAYLLPTALNLVENNDLGYVPSGEKRYFLKRTPEEFIQYRKENEARLKNGQEIMLTPHKVIGEN